MKQVIDHFVLNGWARSAPCWLRKLNGNIVFVPINVLVFAPKIWCIFQTEIVNCYWTYDGTIVNNTCPQKLYKDPWGLVVNYCLWGKLPDSLKQIE